MLIDSTALSMLNGHELVREDFYYGTDQPGVFLAKDSFKKYVQKFETKFRTESRYLTYVDYSVSFRRAMDLQISQFIRAIEEHDPTQYTPVMIDKELDSVRVYKIRGSGEVNLFGISNTITDEEVIIL